ncbi:MAG: hypothetical protein J6L81_04040, partial [Clostridia bacterium]|nr:hypothetical protein [Clostridia bacterium]
MKSQQKMGILKMLSLVLVFAIALGIGVTTTMQHGGNKPASVVSLDTQTALGGASAIGGKVINNTDDSGKQLIGQKENVISSPITQVKLPPLLKTDVETSSSAPAFSPDLLTNAVLSFARYAGTRVFMLTSAVVSGSDAVPADVTQPTEAPTEDAVSEEVSASDTADNAISASDAAGEEGLIDGSSEPEEFLAEGDTYVTFTVTQSYNDSVEDKPTSFGKITLETYGSRITPAGGSSAVQQYNTTSAADGGTISSGAQMSNLKILSYDRKYPISNVQVFVNGADVTSEIGSFISKTTDSYGKAKWTYNFNSGFGFADGSEVVFKIEYGSWEKYTLTQRYSDTIPEASRPSTYGNIYVLSSKGILCDDTTTTNNVTLTKDEQTEIGYIEPNLQINYIEVTPPNSNYYYVDSVKILVDGVDVTDTAIASTNVSSAGVWKLTFKTDYVISAGSTLQVEAVYDGWKTYTLRQDYDSSVNPKPENFGTVTLNGTQSFLPDGFTTLQSSATITATEQSETGLIQPNAALTYLSVSTPSFHSVREVNVYLNGVCVNDEAFNYSDSRTSTPSSGNWTIYFKSGYKVPAGTTLELEVKYGGWQTYELRQDYQDSVNPKPENFGTVSIYGTTSFLPEGFNTLQSNIGISSTEQSETGIIQPEARPTFVHATPPANYSVREIHAYLDGELVDETAFNYSHSSNTMGSIGNWKI